MDYKEKLKAIINSKKTPFVDIDTFLKYFPELKESEDERIRKSLAAFFAKFNPNDMWDDDFSFSDVLAWLEKRGEQKGCAENTTTVNELVTAYTDENGKKWVHLCAGKFDFLLDIKNLSDSENWDDANKLCAENDMELTSKNRWELIQAFRPEVDQIIENLGGEPLEDYLWAGDEYNGRYAWLFRATIGILDNNRKMYTVGVRGSRTFKRY